jgi:hypothetical protein
VDNQCSSLRDPEGQCGEDNQEESCTMKRKFSKNRFVVGTNSVFNTGMFSKCLGGDTVLIGKPLIGFG